MSVWNCNGESLRACKVLCYEDKKTSDRKRWIYNRHPVNSVEYVALREGLPFIVLILHY